MKKFLLTMATTALVLAGCGSATLDGESKDKETTKEKAPSELKVGVSISTLNNPFFVSVKDGIDNLAKENDTKTIVVDAQNDSAKQSNDVDDLIQQQVDVILINPVDSSAIQPAVEAANDAKIPVIAIDRSSDGGEVLTLVASDNVKGGEMAAQFILDKIGENGRVVELQGIPGASATRERGKGFEEFAEGKLELAEKQSAEFDRAKGLTVMENILQSTKDIKAVFAQNDEMALGAIEALEAAGKKDVIVVGFDGNDDGLKAVEEGRLTATIAQQPDEMGKIALQAAYDFFAGKELGAKIDSPLALKEAK
ncbi:D-ribose ABC transporter substrate-binding protein [Vagococcus salmoninarum]|uniref:D-ribose ABC transporter substrate-binding protein n=1 Tax=Vagococcus salmoninarum TaxID=2739 RepID=A0A429ZSC9_9ENTE|nr:D-ribose ABC transporter substrate-binding protein [Vagococcus salmoninarum]MBE9388260.1 D-ribose ABC transporter substrate-binding protein [Vagococcus salmoninarum]RST96529.1 D-ribose ABC transporter substrate-binding protein [Vagococcus salmoninarum]